MSEITTTLKGATRENNSINGNPTWRLHTTDGDYLTELDASVGYDVDNHVNPDMSEPWLGKEIVLTTVDPGRRVAYWRLADE